MASVTPLKDREIIILSTGTGSGMKKALYKSLKAICSSGACGFNVAVSMPPFMKAKGWEGFPFVTRVLCRGNPLQRTSDIGSMELYASSIISSDPYDVIRQYRKQ